MSTGLDAASENCTAGWALARSDPKRYSAVFDRNCSEDLEHWTRTDRKTALRALKLIKATLRDPFAGPGKPERLRGELAGCWSRRIDTEHRLVYRVEGCQVWFLAARYSY